MGTNCPVDVNVVKFIETSKNILKITKTRTQTFLARTHDATFISLGHDLLSKTSFDIDGLTDF